MRIISVTCTDHKNKTFLNFGSGKVLSYRYAQSKSSSRKVPIVSLFIMLNTDISLPVI